MIVVNLFGAPGCGKSTVAAGLYSRLKQKGYNAELVSEFAKEITWEGHFTLLRDQLYLLAHQNRKLERLKGKVDIVVTDSPLLLTLAYVPPNYYGKFKDFVYEIWESYKNLNIFLERDVEFDKVGRVHDEQMSASLRDVISHLTTPDLSFKTSSVDYDLIEETVLGRLITHFQ